MAQRISERDKTSMAVDRRKVAEAQRILGTATMTETVDAALDEVINLDRRRRLVDRLRRSTTGGIGPTPDELRRLREP
jgi:Arc/MetJ family transcription regulator